MLPILEMMLITLASALVTSPLTEALSFSPRCVKMAVTPSDASRPGTVKREMCSTDSSRRAFLVGSASTAVTVGALGSNPVATRAAASAAVETSKGSPLQVSSGGKVTLPKIGIGAWSWGDSLFWGYDRKLDGELREVFEYALERNLAFFDTAELYGNGRSETLLGQFRDACSPDDADRVSIATKFAALPWRTKPQDVVNACRASVKRLGGRPIDLYQVHFPNAWSNAEYWEGLADAYDEGLVRLVGVSNYGVDATRAAHAALAKRGIQLATNQIQFSLLYRAPIENGLLDTCNDLGVKVLSYSPLALGLLAGKYSRDNLPKGPRKALAEKLFNGENDAYSSLIGTMKEVATSHGNVPVSQVAINWAISKGTTPIPGARNLGQATQNLESVNWSLTESEVKRLDMASANVPAIVDSEKSPFPKKDINTGLIMFDS